MMLFAGLLAGSRMSFQPDVFGVFAKLDRSA
jgi:hypothetical protein